MSHYAWAMLFSNVKPLSHQSGVLTAFPQRFKKLQNAEVRAVQTPATLWKRCGNAVETPCNRLERHAAAFILSMLKTNAAAWRSTAC